MNFKHLSGILALFLILTTPLLGAIEYRLEDFEKQQTKSNFGLVTVQGASFFKGGISPDFNLGPLGVGVDLNLYVPLSSSKNYPPDLNSVVLRMLSYTHDNMAGIKFGWLRNVTFGYGLLMDKYDSGSGGSTEFNTSKAGIMGYLNFFPYRVDAMWTIGNVKAVRGCYTIPDTFLLGSSLIFGANYVTDTDGLSYSPDGSAATITRPSKQGLSIDAGAPIGGDFLTLFAEHARLAGTGENLDKAKAGTAAGFKGTFFGQVDYRLDYRSLQAGFAPSYFNNTYEGTGFNDNQNLPKTDLSGFLGLISTSIMEDYIKAGFEYEAYQGKDPLITAAAGWRQIAGTVGVINYTIPFQGKQNATMKMDILYMTGGVLDYVVSLKRTYLTLDTFMESYGVAVRFNASKLIPGLPF